MSCCCQDLLLPDPFTYPVPDCELGGTPPAITSFNFAVGGVNNCECGDINQFYVCDTKVNECNWSPNLPFFICNGIFFDSPVFVRLDANMGGTLYKVWLQVGVSGSITLTSSAQYATQTDIDFFKPFTLPLISTSGCASGWPSTITVVPVVST